jgi:hypothetical protein
MSQAKEAPRTVGEMAIFRVIVEGGFIMRTREMGIARPSKPVKRRAIVELLLGLSRCKSTRSENSLDRLQMPVL